RLAAAATPQGREANFLRRSNLAFLSCPRPSLALDYRPVLAVVVARRQANHAMETNDWSDAERRVEHAQELFEQRKWQEALEELRAATAINPYNAAWFFNIGLTLDELGRPEEAIEAYRQASAIDPNDVQAMNHLAVDLHHVGKYDEALATF